MENASKALLMAGAMLLIVMLLTFAVYFMKKLGYQANTFYEDMSETEIFEFNQKFFNYETQEVTQSNQNKEIQYLKIQDVVSIINLVKNANEKNQTPDGIKVYLDGAELNLESIDIFDYLKGDLNNEKPAKYSCVVEYAKNSLFVGKIKINKVNNN